jgi:hypothetical protein
VRDGMIPPAVCKVVLSNMRVDPSKFGFELTHSFGELEEKAVLEPLEKGEEPMISSCW